MRALAKKIRELLILQSASAKVIGGFVLTLVAGGLLLWLPFSHQPGRVSLLDALFTSTSAVCVTGLAVVDTARDYTLAGQLIILALIQLGGIGLMSYAAIAFKLVKKRLSLNAQAALYDSLLQHDFASEFSEIFWRLARIMVAIELLGAAVLFLGLLPAHEPLHALYSSIFHSVSAFCNAGFSIYSDNLMGLRDNHVFTATLMVLIILGGIGDPVLLDLWKVFCRERGKKQTGPSPFTLHTRVVVSTSAVLVIGGAGLLVLFGLTPAEKSWDHVVSGALFQSVSARTAGFNTVDLGKLSLPSLMVMLILMFIGGSPGSCCGGIKTTTFTIMISQLWALLHGRNWARIFGRHIPGDITRRAAMLIGIAIVWNLAGMVLLLTTESGVIDGQMQHVIFEQVSAYATVGLSTGLTPKLSVAGKLWIMLSMLVGRLGPITIVLWMFTRESPKIQYPEGRVMIG
ncbi:MAG: potassium transporter TrkG [Candidatus Eremiobacteraeota bacterium]|nr:potassium transporter TrkG [Candidatus Eremiobacteraeota bacterium]